LERVVLVDMFYLSLTHVLVVHPDVCKQKLDRRIMKLRYLERKFTGAALILTDFEGEILQVGTLSIFTQAFRYCRVMPASVCSAAWS